MNLPAYQSFISPEEYLEGETRSEIRHEYVDGEVYAMSGASEAHNIIALNIGSLLRNHLRGTPCRVFMSDMKVRIQSLRDERYYYPDLQVTCAPEDRDRYFKQWPKLVIEVLSPTTERNDQPASSTKSSAESEKPKFLCVYFSNQMPGMWLRKITTSA
jgi:Uma2 family endonuclease